MRVSFFYSVLFISMLLIPFSVNYANERGDINAKGFHRAITQFKTEPKVAVVVGINTYHPNSGLQSLKYAEKDAFLLNNVLKRQGYSVSLLINKNALKAHILQAIKTAGDAIHRRNHGTLIFVFSGHGFSYKNRNYLAPFGTISTRFANTALPLDEVIIAIKKIGVRRAVLFIDACRDKPTMNGARSVAAPSFVYRKSEGVKILYSTKFGGVSYESDQLKHGIFSHFLSQALNGAQVNRNGKVTFETVKRYVEDKVALWIHQHQMPEQLPFVSGNSHGVFILGNKQQAPSRHVEKFNRNIKRNTIKNQTVLPQRSRKNKVYGQYRDNGNGTITDLKNKLMWKKCSEGQTENSCSGKAKTYTWETAISSFSNMNYAGFNDWQLPTKNELKSLVYCSNKVNQNIAIKNSCFNPKNTRYQRPTINLKLFPNTSGSPLVSSVPYAHRSADVWGISFLTGQEVRVRKGAKFHVRLVRRMK